MTVPLQHNYAETSCCQTIPTTMEELARDLAVVPMLLVNAYLVGDSRSWVLIDSGTPGSADTVKRAAEARFGPQARPRGIVLTHGHFDHAGSANDLAQMWNVPVYASRLEHPYLTGRSSYPPLDPTAPGAFSALTRFLSPKVPPVTARLAELTASVLPEIGLADWEIVETPGHTPGHVSFFRRSDGTLLAGDALTTVDMDNLLGLLTKHRQVCRPPAPATTDWPQARQSVQALAALPVFLIAAGHGAPMANVHAELTELAEHFPIPEHGRYVPESARADESGVTYLPPPPPDKTPRIAAGVAAAVVLSAVGALLLKINTRRQS